MEDYALRFAPRSFRKWSEFQVANSAFGSTSFLVLEAVGGFLSINYGFTNAIWAILAVGLLIFITSLPISYYAARYNIDIDLLTRSAGFGYVGSTITSLIYASFTFFLFALEASIMSLALEMYFKIPSALAHVISAVIVIPLVTFGITTISRFQLWTQPVWLLLFILPYVGVMLREPDAALTIQAYLNIAANGEGFNWLAFGTASTIAFSMIAQIGEQVDFLRFLPNLTKQNKRRWWFATITAGPGWIIIGMAREIGGALLAHLAVRHGITPIHAHEPTQMYLTAYGDFFADSQTALTFTCLFVVLSQMKINVTNAYAGSLAWSNFFSRLTHSHPGRVIWLYFNVFISLLLMEFSVFNALEKVLGLLSNVSIAWISTVAADLLINKPLGLSPKSIEFKRAILPDLNPVGTLTTLFASVISILAYIGCFGEYPKAFSGFIALGLSFVLAPILALIYGKSRYLARNPIHYSSDQNCACSICVNSFEKEDMTYCPYYEDNICSLCCTLDSNCMDMCKPGFRWVDYLNKIANSYLPKTWTLTYKLRLVRFSLLFIFLIILSSAFIGIIYYQDILANRGNQSAINLLQQNCIKIYSSLLVFIGLCTWWLTLNDESRRVAQEEISKQTERLLVEIQEHKKTDAMLQEATKAADRANIAKSRFLSSMSHEIRTPLNSIIGYAYLLQNDPAIPKHRKQAVAIVKRSGEHLASLIEDILDIARIEACKFEFSKDNINFPGLIEHLCSLFKPQAEAKALSFVCQIKNILPLCVRGDEKRVGQILINLLGNAIKFTGQGQVTFSIAYNCGVATFQVIDTGPGIEATQLENIFQPFTQLPQENLVSGSGLGLTISKVLTELMGGELTVGSSPGMGTTFTVRLYLANLGDDIELHQTKTIVGFEGARQNILVVDDQTDHRELIKAILEPIGFIVYEAKNSEECYQTIEKVRIDLILLDLAMPGIDGFQVAKNLRQASFSKPIIVLSANAYSNERMNAINAGCNDFLAKPIQVQDLFNKLKLHLGLSWLDEQDLNLKSPEFSTYLPLGGASLTNEDFKAMHDFIKIGDLIGLNKMLEILSKTKPDSLEYITHVQNLSKAFRINDLKKIITSDTVNP